LLLWVASYGGPGMTTMNRWQRLYCLALAIFFDVASFSIIYEEEKPLSADELDQKVEDFREMISRGEVDWD